MSQHTAGYASSSAKLPPEAREVLRRALSWAHVVELRDRARDARIRARYDHEQRVRLDELHAAIRAHREASR